MTRRRRIAPDSVFDTDAQLEEYRRLMGEEAADRQERALKIARGECVCRPVTYKKWVDGNPVFRTVHERGCVKHKDWMDSYLDGTEPGVAKKWS